ncbi:hypothetical protein MTP09_08540 [Chryseobacterium suipulveris]|uniref:Uncharacterized protein n=1 Tax=Chryseobacterium suipulveris TaxID=2929800 RepID=A0ABY4BQB5_9FLAO|nr:hypothetical protein [Chryseobacterium suipulveris]UOE39971.1 hypothetical protein MTP09_08540 [Chryseobacterium suipulveris]
MYTSYIGKKFLELYNKKENKNYSAEEFFNGEFFPLFFHDDSHLMHVGNSPFFQKPKAEDVEKHGGKAKAQLANLHQSILNDVPNMSIFVGYAAKDVGGTTSGQLSSIDVAVDSEEMYASWIGQAFGIGVSGGYVMLIDNEDLMFTIYNGWTQYRKFLKTPNVKDKQIETWNGQWVSYCFSDDFNASNPGAGLQIETAEVQGNTAIPTKQWSEVIFYLSKKYSKEKDLIAYSYNLSQTNTTLGFIKIFLHEITEMYELRDKLFIDKEDTILTDKEIIKLGTFYNFKAACQTGMIGLKALEPAKLREYMPKGSVLYAQGKELKFANEESYQYYQLYKIWITAMLNKTDLLHLAEKIAEVLLKFEKEDERGKKVHATISADIRESRSLVKFIENISELMDKTDSDKELFKSVVEEVLKMPSDNFPLFITLIRFEYNFQK